MTVSVTEQDAVVTVTVAGELDVSTVPAFNKELSELRQNSATTLVLDLSGTTFMDSTGLSAVLVAEMHARMRGQRFKVVAGPPHVHELFKLTGRRQLPRGRRPRGRHGLGAPRPLPRRGATPGGA